MFLFYYTVLVFISGYAQSYIYTCIYIARCILHKLYFDHVLLCLRTVLSLFFPFAVFSSIRHFVSSLMAALLFLHISCPCVFFCFTMPVCMFTIYDCRVSV